MNKVLYTIGHSNISFDNFYKLLCHWKINCIIDIRSKPFTSYTPHFNKENLQKALRDKKISYLHFKDEFGARRTENNLYDESGQLDFEKVAKSSLFQRGVERLENGLEKGFNIALMCACSHPLSCHRFFMISIYLANEKGINLQHIFPFKKDIYKNFISEEDKEEISIMEEKRQLRYFIRMHQELESFDKQNFDKKHNATLSLFENLEEDYLKNRNKKIGYHKE